MRGVHVTSGRDSLGFGVCFSECFGKARSWQARNCLLRECQTEVIGIQSELSICDAQTFYP
jgi:hypothetical protein